MLSFMTKRRAKKLDLPIRRVQSPPSPASFSSPEIVDINEKFGLSQNLHQLALRGQQDGVQRLDGQSQDSYYDSTRLDSPHVDVEFSTEPLSNFFPPELLGRDPPRPRVDSESDRRAIPDSGVRHVGRNVNGSRSGLGFTANDAMMIESDPIQNVNRSGFLKTDDEVRENTPPHLGRKLPPAPIRIPSVSVHGPKIQIQRTTEAVSKRDPYSSAYEPTPAPLSRPDSLNDGADDDMSTISGTTFAQALITNSFILTGNDYGQSRHRSGMARQDSATLPRGEHPFINSPYWRDKHISSNGSVVSTPNSGRNSDIPPVPPVPSSALGLDVVPGKLNLTSPQPNEQFRHSGSHLLPETPPLSKRASTSRLHPTDQINLHRVSRISEAPSPSSSSPGSPPNNQHSPAALSSAGRNAAASHSSLSQQSSPGLGETRSPAPSSALSSSSSARPLPSAPFSESSGAFSERSGEDIDHVLDNYQFVSPLDSRFMGPSSSSSSRTGLSVTSAASSARPKSQNRPRDSSLSSSSARVNTPDISISNLSSSRAGSESRLLPSHRSKYPQRSVALLPIGERHRSLVPHSPMISTQDDDSHHTLHSTLSQRRSQASRHSLIRSRSSASSSRRLSIEAPIDSPDLLDELLVPVTHSIFNRQRFGSTPNPIRIVRGGDRNAYSITVTEDTEDDGATTSTSWRGHQTFPETPKAFSPLWSPPVSSPAIPPMPPLRSNDVNRMRTVFVTGVSTETQISRTEQALLNGPATAPAVSHRASSQVVAAPSTPPPSAHPSLASDADRKGSPQPETMSATPGPLQTPLPTSAGSTSTLSLPQSPSPVPGQGWSSQPPRGISPAKVPPHNEPQASLNGLPESPRANAPVSPLTPVSAPRSVPSPPPLSRPPPAPPFTSGGHLSTLFTPSFMPPPPYQAVAPDLPVRASTHPEYTPSGSSTRRVRSRPPLPIGPRRPSHPSVNFSGSIRSIGERDRSGSVSSFTSTATVTVPRSRRPSVASLQSPKFQTVPVRFRGYTIDMAKWSFTSAQLQAIVSRAIVHSGQTSSIRLLSLDVLDIELPEEMRRLELLSGELKMRYKLLARKRNALLASLIFQAENSNLVDHTVSQLQELTDTSAMLDQSAEELHIVEDQIQQLRRLCDIHSSSALAMALRKLNTSWAKKSAEAEVFRLQVEALQAERDEAWKQAEDVAQEFDDLQDRVVDVQTPSSGKSPSRRSSRVLVARKTSLRASKAGLRTSTGRRSQRSSVSSAQRISSVPSAARSTFSSDDVPPVPPIPRPRPGIVTTNLAGRISLGVPCTTALSATRAMVEAELCKMLGIAVNDLETPDSRRFSVASVEIATRPVSSSSATLNRRASLPANANLGKYYDAMTNDSSW